MGERAGFVWRKCPKISRALLCGQKCKEMDCFDKFLLAQHNILRVWLVFCVGISDKNLLLTKFTKVFW
jgi:hypothetical protein